jgi:hypothetical protein
MVQTSALEASVQTLERVQQTRSNVLNFSMYSYKNVTVTTCVTYRTKRHSGYCSDCTIQVPVPPARAGCWRVCKTRAQPPRPLVRREARADVRSFSNLGLLSRSAMYESVYVEWDVDMVFEEPEAEPCLPSRSSPHRARPPSSGQPASSALANCGAGVDASAPSARRAWDS